MADAPLVRQPGTLIRKRKDGTLEVPDNPTIAYVEDELNTRPEKVLVIALSSILRHAQP